jgi:exosortase/archaeosortase family protein
VIRGRHAVVIRGLIAVALLPVVFILLQDPFRQVETQMSVATLHLLGASQQRVVYIPNNEALIISRAGVGFLVQLTPACSALAPMLGLTVIASLIDRAAPSGRQLLAAGAGLAAIFIGNQIRIDASMVAGIGFGQGTLVLFHDWAGSIFGFAYMTLGFILMLWLLLPPDGDLSVAGLPRPRRLPA